MKYLKFFEELNPSTYRSLKDKTADYPFSKFSAKTDADKSRAEKMGRINQLSQERFEQEFYNQFPKDSTTIKVYDSANPKNMAELSLEELQWRANWTYFDLYFKQEKSPFYSGDYSVHIKFHGDATISGGRDAYTLDKGDRLGFKGDIMIDGSSQQLLNSMFLFGRDMIEQPKEETPMVKQEEPKGFISKLKNWWK